ncbi:hypothetical protein [Chryseobacterium sp. JM1]|uniref:hypothetical protein n=1 Tax=Chryseobacterium sp. JM1 TaxID=1233950 RepID=UPI0004E6ED7C|nr:hypothetical protein [Chryseobacterium sp. JM1]KFF22698.1 hypothetical protein IW22_00110 [Chryseobacterium sp. JM1]
MKNKLDKFEKFNKKAGLNKEILTHVKGGSAGPGPGYIFTVSGECNSSGKSCWKILKDLIGL